MVCQFIKLRAKEIDETDRYMLEDRPQWDLKYNYFSC